MKIYTKTGDAGTTGLLGRTRVSKSDARVRSYGALDELNAQLGWAFCLDGTMKPLVTQIQAELFQLGAELATPEGETPSIPLVSSDAIERLEKQMDEWEEELPPLKNFILPGGTENASRIHIARTICRNAERQVVRLHEKSNVRDEVLVYLNRLSDWLFLAARIANLRQKVSDVPWNPPT